ncbi:MAG: hypothetical protein RLP15_09180 [Cryomorphaceae bacterium]
MRQSVIGLVLLFIGIRAIAQELPFPERKGQLEFYSTMTIGEPMLVEGPGDFFKGRATLSGNIGVQHRIALPHGFGLGIGGELGIFPYNWASRDVFSDSLFDDHDGYYLSNGAEYFSGFTMSIPFSLSKRFELPDRTRLRISLAALFNFHPFTINNGGVGGSAGIVINDSTEFTYMISEVFPTSPPYSYSIRPGIGIEFTTKHQNTIGLDAVLHLSNHRLNEGYAWDLREDGIPVNYELSQRINYIGLRFRYGFTYRPEELRTWVLGSEQEVESHTKKIARKPTKHWLTFSAGVMEIKESLKDANGFYASTFFPNGRVGASFEVNDTLNWKLGFHFYQLWIVDGHSEQLSFFNGATGGGTIFEFDGAIGKDVVSTEKGGFKLKPWLGAGLNVYPGNRWNEPDGASLWSSSAFYNGNDTLFKDSAITYMRNDMNVFLRAGMELDIRLLRRLRLSVLPSYTFGVFKLYETDYTYWTPNDGVQAAQLTSRGSHWSVSFQLKFPLDFIGKQQSDD